MAMGLRFNGRLAAEDMAAKGLDIQDLANRSGLSQRTVYRFLNDEVQTIQSARRIASALGYSVRRYLVRSQEAA